MGCCSWRLLGALAVAGAILAGVLRVKLAARTNEFLADESLLDDPTMQAIDGYVQNIFTTQESLQAKMQTLVDTDAARDKVYFITGGSRGLGRGIAARALAMGAKVYFTGRTFNDALVASIIDDARAISPGRVADEPFLSAMGMDLSDLDDVARAVKGLAAAGVRIDVLVLNAGLVPSGSTTTRQGFELALGVNCVGHHVFTQALLAEGLLRPNARIVVVTSETHRSVGPLNVERLFEDMPEFGVSEAVAFYGRSKLCVNTVSSALQRQVNSLEGVNAAVHTICPGPVATDIAREAPWYLRPLVDFIFMVGFQTPTAASIPIVWLGSAPEHGCEGNCAAANAYFHMNKQKVMRSDCEDVAKGDALVAAMERKVAELWPAGWAAITKSRGEAA